MFAKSPIAIAIAALLIAPTARGADPVKLEKDDVQKAIAGKTITYNNINGSSVSVFFETSGRVTYRTGGGARPSSGTWEVDDRGRYCVKITSGGAQDHCRSVWKTDSGYGLGSTTGELVPAGIN